MLLPDVLYRSNISSPSLLHGYRGNFWLAPRCAFPAGDVGEKTASSSIISTHSSTLFLFPFTSQRLSRLVSPSSLHFATFRPGLFYLSRETFQESRMAVDSCDSKDFARRLGSPGCLDDDVDVEYKRWLTREK